MPNYWFCSVSHTGKRSKIAHLVRGGKACCGANIFGSTTSAKDPAELNARACRRCQVCKNQFTMNPGPRTAVIKKMTWKSDFFYVVEIDGLLYYFQFDWWLRKLANDPGEMGIGIQVAGEVVKQYDLRDVLPVADNTFEVSPAWRPIKC